MSLSPPSSSTPQSGFGPIDDDDRFEPPKKAPKVQRGLIEKHKISLGRVKAAYKTTPLELTQTEKEAITKQIRVQQTGILSDGWIPIYVDYSDGWKQRIQGSKLYESDLSLADRIVCTYKRINPETRKREVFHTYLHSSGRPEIVIHVAREKARRNNDYFTKVALEWLPDRGSSASLQQIDRGSSASLQQIDRGSSPSLQQIDAMENNRSLSKSSKEWYLHRGTLSPLRQSALEKDIDAIKNTRMDAMENNSSLARATLEWLLNGGASPFSRVG